MALHQKFLRKRNSCQDLHNLLGGPAIAVGIRHATQGVSKLDGVRFADGFEDRVDFGRGIDDVSRPLSPLLPQADTDSWQSKGGGLHDPTAGIAEEKMDLAEKATIGQGIEIDEQM